MSVLFVVVPFAMSCSHLSFFPKQYVTDRLGNNNKNSNKKKEGKLISTKRVLWIELAAVANCFGKYPI